MLRICTATGLAALATLFAPGTAHASDAAPTVAYLRAGDVYVAAGTTVHRLTADGHNSRPRWSPDGRRIAYRHDGALWLMNGDGTGKRRVAATAAGGASWSPDGRRLAFVAGCDGPPAAFTVSSSAPADTPVPLLPGVSCAAGPAPVHTPGAGLAARLRYDDSVAWSRDGRRIAFRGGDCEAVFDDCLTVADVATGRQTAVDAYGGGGVVDSGFAVVPEWSPDGARLSWTTWREGGDITVVEADPSGARRRQVGTAQDRELAYAGPGRAVLTTTRDGVSWLVLVDLGTGARTYLRPGSQPSPSPAG